MGDGPLVKLGDPALPTQIASIFSLWFLRGANAQGGLKHSFKKRSSGVAEPLKPRRDNYMYRSRIL